MNLLQHYKKLILFNFYRFREDNYPRMCEYFAGIFLYEIEEYISLQNKTILDVGGANGEFCKFLSENRNCKPINVEPFPKKIIWSDTIKAPADAMPFQGNTFDVALLRNVLEHISYEKQQLSLDEIYRVLKPGGIGYFAIPPWYNPHAGHQLKPFHIFPFAIAKFLRKLFFRNNIPGNSYEECDLYKITFKKMNAMILRSGFKILDTKDTHFRLHFFTKIPVIREIAVPAVAFIVKKPYEKNYYHTDI